MANVSVANTPGLYQINTTNSILTNAQNLYTLLANSSSVGFYLTNANADVAATTLPTGVTSGTYGNLLYYPIITVGLDGRVTSASIVPTATSGYGNANVAAYLTGAVTIGNLTVTSGVFWPNGQPYGTGTVYGNANVAAYLPTYAGTLNNSSTIIAINANVAAANTAIANLQSNIGSFYTYANATYSTQANAASQESEISSLRSNITAANTAIAATNANIGSFYTYANVTYSTIANAASQEGEISSLRSNVTAANTAIANLQSNIGSFYTYANVTYQTIAGAYGNSNVASYLPSYGGNIGSLATNGTTTVIQTFTSGSVWTAPIDIVSANILLVGGGGSGGSSNYALAPAGGGGAGGVLWTGNLANITPGQQFTITIGSGAAAPAAGNVNGNPGNNTTVTWPGSSYTAYGGGYGAGGSLNNFGGNGAGGGGGSIVGTSGTSGGYAIYGTQGTKGGPGIYTSLNLMGGGYGGGAGAAASPGSGQGYADPIYLTNSGSSVAYAGGGYPGYTNNGTPSFNPGNQGVGYGGGGGGGATVPGTAGTQGVVIISYQVPNYLMNAYSNNIVANAVTITNLQVLNSITADRVSTTNGYFWSNGTSYASTVSNYGNSNVAVYLASNTDATISSLTANTQQQQAQINSINANVTAVNVAIASTNANLASFETYANATFSTGGGSSYGNSNVAAYLPTYNGTLNNSSTIIAINANLASFETYANATYSTIANAGVLQSEITAANASIATINANIGSFYTYANATYSTIANAASQESEISSLRSNITAANASIASTNANLASFETYANATFGTSNYGNANVTALLSGAVTIGNLTVNAGVFWSNGNPYSSGSGGTIYGNANVAAYLPTYTGDIGNAGTPASTGYFNTVNATTLSGALSGSQTGITAIAGYTEGGGVVEIQDTSQVYIHAPVMILGDTTYSQTTGINGQLQVNSGNATLYGGGYFIGDGSKLTNLNLAPGAYGNANVAAYLPTYSGVLTAGNITTTNGVYWSNGAAYSTGSSFTGNLAGQTLYDGSNNYIIANAYPFSPISTSVGSSYQQLYFRNPKGVYVNGILQNNSTTNGYIISSAQQANIALRTGSGTQQTVFGTTAYMQVWPANVTMNNNDRYRGAGFVSEVNLNGATWGTMSSASATAPTLVGFNSIASVLGNGNANHVIANYSAPYIVPANGSANVQYATVLYGAIQFAANAANNYTASNIAYARLVAGSLSLSGNLTVQNAIGLHTVNGWAGTAFSSLVTNQRYAVLNEDASTIIQTNGNIVVTTPAAATTGFNSAGVFTVTQLNAVTGVVGQIAAVSNGSAKNGGQFAYWDTTNARWSWFDTNLAVS